MIQERGVRICMYMRSEVRSVRKRDKGPMAGRKYVLGSGNRVWRQPEMSPESREVGIPLHYPPSKVRHPTNSSPKNLTHHPLGEHNYLKAYHICDYSGFHRKANSKQPFPSTLHSPTGPCALRADCAES